MNLLKYVASRGREPSTYAGLAAVLAMFGMHADPGVIQDVTSAATGIFGLIALLTKG